MFKQQHFKYVALVTVNESIATYYGNLNDFGLAEEKPTITLKGNQIVNYPFAHTVNLISMYSTSEEVLSNLSSPLHFMINGFSIYIEKIYKRGGEAVIFQGTFNQIPVLFRRYVKLARKLRLLPSEISEYLPKKYLLFEDGNDVHILIMEHLQELIFTDRIYEQSMLFLQKMQSLNEIHGDISPGNVMQDSEGNVKFIDFSRGKFNKGTNFYSQGRNDKQAMAIVLLNCKYKSLIKEHYQQLGLMHDNSYKYTLDKLYKLKELDEIKFFKWVELNFPQDKQSYKLLEMINISN